MPESIDCEDKGGNYEYKNVLFHRQAIYAGGPPILRGNINRLKIKNKIKRRLFSTNGQFLPEFTNCEGLFVSKCLVSKDIENTAHFDPRETWSFGIKSLIL